MAGMMGWPVERLHRSTLPELFFTFRGFLRGQGIDPDGNGPDAPLTRAELDALMEEYPDDRQDD